MVLLGVSAQTVYADPAENTPDRRSAEFALGFAALKAQLGDVMGEPVEVEHPASDEAEVQQTTTGLAVYRVGELPKFTDGWNTYTLKVAAPPPVASVSSQSSGRIACIIRVESQGNPNAKNRSGASGLGQFLPGTWASTPQGKAGLSVFNPAANSAAIAWMISVGRANEFDAVRYYGC